MLKALQLQGFFFSRALPAPFVMASVDVKAPHGKKFTCQRALLFVFYGVRACSENHRAVCLTMDVILSG
jgi:hypothetical protein